MKSRELPLLMLVAWASQPAYAAVQGNCTAIVQSMKAYCPSLDGADFVSTSLRKYSTCPSPICSIALADNVNEPGLCVLHWNHSCYPITKPNSPASFSSCCPAMENYHILPYWTNKLIDNSITSLKLSGPFSVQILANTFQKPNATMFLTFTPDPETDFPSAIGQGYNRAASLSIEGGDDMPLKPLRWTASQPYSLYGGDAFCSLPGRTYRSLLYYHDAPRARWLSLPNQTYANSTTDAWISQQIFQQERGRVFLLSIYTELKLNTTSAENVDGQYTIPESGMWSLKKLLQVGSIESIMCLLPVAVDGTYNNQAAMIRLASTGMRMLGSPFRTRWPRGSTISSPGEYVSIDMRVPRTVADAMDANNTGLRRSSSTVGSAILFPSYFDPANETWGALSNCTGYIPVTQIITCYVQQSFLAEHGMELVLVLLARNNTVAAMAFWEAETEGFVDAKATATPAPAAPQTTTPAPSKEGISNIAILVAVVAAVVVCMAIICMYTRKHNSESAGSYAPVKAEMSTAIPELHVGGFFRP